MKGFQGTPDRTDTDVIVKRAFAQVIDLFLIFALSFIVLIVLGTIGGVLGATGSSNAFASVFSTIGILMMIGILLGYSFVLEAFWDGRTIGKRLLGLKVVKEDGSPVDIGSALIRNIPALVSLGWIAYLVALFSMAASDRRQRLFDRLAGTVVVQEQG